MAAHPHDSPGLDKGVGGAALFLARMHQRTADAQYLEQAIHVLTNSTHMAADSRPSMPGPSLSNGSAGAALSLAACLAHCTDQHLSDALDQHLAAASLPLAIAPGLLSGTAGQLYVLSTHHDARAAQAARTLWRYAIPYGEGVMMPGDNLMRLSTDLATGSAGALLALESHRRGSDLMGPLLAA
ncbi:lanthionine synthetase LanC family protein [Streptomyces sp. NRRL B-1347]|uniref:lanthionine synthetase LanC family protein n=1 Tax=Streptomyces sp. NRRL B-1347 TaxID=1476877 RepID=UPI000D143AE0|nr:lanthionine synthetase LanC family protein [Streptomyces sp. NRRL B-1347]